MDEHIEIRSERMQHIVGEMPNYLLRYGVLVGLFVAGILLSVGCLVRYPSTFAMRGQLLCDDTISLFLPRADGAEKVGAGMPIEVGSGETTVWRTEVVGKGRAEKGDDGAWTMKIHVIHMPDTIRTGGFVYLFTEGSPLTIKAEGKKQSLLQHIIKNRMN